VKWQALIFPAVVLAAAVFIWMREYRADVYTSDHTAPDNVVTKADEEAE
jgi:hypothetical protein